jgi:hypothetical protein
VVECGDEGMFWRVNAEHLLTVTRDFKEASAFHIIPADDTYNENDFYIGWQGEKSKENREPQHSPITPTKTTARIMRYLEVKTFFCGHCSGPLKLTSEVSSTHSRLCLYNQISQGFFDYCEDDITPWTEKGEASLISNNDWKSFVSVVRYRNKEQADPDQEDAYGYTTKCMGSRRAHNEKDIWMLFRLIPQMEKVSTMGKIKSRLSRELAKYTEQ